MAISAVVIQPLGETESEATIAGPGVGEPLQSPGPLKETFNAEESLKVSVPTFQPGMLYPEAEVAAAWWGQRHAGAEQSGAAETPTSSVAPLQPVQIRPATYIEHDVLWAYLKDPMFDPYLPAPPPSAPVQAASGALSEGEARAFLTAAGWPEHLHNEALAIAHCESRHRPGAVGDGGNSLGWFQLWYGWFSKAGYSSADYADPVVNATVARYVYEVRGRWGGGGGWSCAALVGLH